MICNFPIPYPDEILYSVCARYSDRMRYSSTRTVIKDLFGRDSIARVALPTDLRYLQANLPSKPYYTVTSLIDNNTLLPFYEPFLPPGRASLIRNMMEIYNAKPILGQMGLSHRDQPRLSMRFCPHCVQEDRENFGECYWHRVHQISGVEVCPYHSVYLKNSKLNPLDTTYRHTFLSAEGTIKDSSISMIETSNICLNKFLRIAQDVLWLLQNPDYKIGLSSIQKKYLNLLKNDGLASYGGLVYTSKLLQSFKQHYTEDFLEILHCELGESIQRTWLTLLPRKKRVFYPIGHLLLIHFLGHTVESFFNLPSDPQYFEAGPWPCLNPVCKHYYGSSILNYEINCRSYSYGRNLRGFFSCECGFIYSRIGPDLLGKNRFRASKVEVHGSIWETKLRELWGNPSISISQASHILGVAKRTVKIQAKKLGLLFPRPFKRANSSYKGHYNTSTSNISHQSTQERYRTIWLSTVEENSTDEVMQIKDRIPQAYNWLHRYDREWITLHTPKRKYNPLRKHTSPLAADWQQRDVQFAIEARSSALFVANIPGYPVQITLTTITNNMKQKHIIRQNIHKLPLTFQSLAEFTETKEKFALRRVQWLTKCYKEENVSPTRAQFLQRGKLREAKWISVKNSIEDALQTLNANKL